MDERREIEIDTVEMGEYILEKLIEKGFIPTDEEIDTISDIVFDYLVHKSVVEEVDE
jgi:uncharacterized protein YfeS